MPKAILSSIVEKTTTIKEIWESIIKLYKVKSFHIRMFLKKKMYTLLE